jgi:hypothetical protein
MAIAGGQDTSTYIGGSDSGPSGVSEDPWASIAANGQATLMFVYPLARKTPSLLEQDRVSEAYRPLGRGPRVISVNWFGGCRPPNGDISTTQVLSRH